MYELAEHLHKTVEEIGEMTTVEYVGWRAYFDVRAHEATVAEAEAEGKTVWIRAPWEVSRRG